MMRNHSPAFIRALVVSFFLTGAASLSAYAQSQTTLAAGFYGSFSGTTTGNGTIQSPASQAGGLFELRYISNPLMGYELTYSYNRADQTYSIPSLERSVKAGAHEITGDWVVSAHVLNFRPFVLAGVGVINFVPDSGQTGTSSSAHPVFIYGGGVDWGILPHFGLRGQYRGNLYHAPDLLNVATSTDAFAHSAQPVIGAYFRF